MAKKVNLPMKYEVGGRRSDWLNPNNLALGETGATRL